MKLIVGVMTIVFGFSLGLCTSQSGVTITKVEVSRAGGIMVYSSVDRSLGSGHMQAYFFANTVAGSKEMMANILTAKSTGATVDLFGTGTCNEWNIVESL